MIRHIKKLLRWLVPPQETTVAVEPESGYGWQLPIVGHGPADLPPSMRTWKADPVADRGLFEELNPTQTIPRVSVPLPSPRYAAATAVLENAYNDVAVKCKAAEALLMGSDVNTVLAGLQAYVSLHPAAA